MPDKTTADLEQQIKNLTKRVKSLETEVETLKENFEELNDYVESIDEDFQELEDTLFHDDDPDGMEDGDSEDGEPAHIIYQCPHCERDIIVKAEDEDFDEDMKCPHCGKPAFP